MLSSGGVRGVIDFRADGGSGVRDADLADGSVAVTVDGGVRVPHGVVRTGDDSYGLVWAVGGALGVADAATGIVVFDPAGRDPPDGAVVLPREPQRSVGACHDLI